MTNSYSPSAFASPIPQGPSGTHFQSASSEYEEEPGDRRILIVDDERGIREVFAQWLGEDFECQTAQSADDALAFLAEKTYALVISDMMMPGRNGVELLREVTAKYPETALIMVSGVDRPQRMRDALRLGAFDYLIKPCEMDVLTLSVEHALERRALQRTARVYKSHLENQNNTLAKQKAELERLQAQMVHTEKMASLGQLAAGVAHELNNPAGFVFGNMDLLGDDLVLIEKLFDAYNNLPLTGDALLVIESVKNDVDYARLMGDLGSIVADCRDGAQRICDVVKNLRLFSRLDEAELKQVNIHDGIESTLRLLSRYYNSDRLTLRKEYGELPLVTCYAGQLNQVWMNLLVNAAQSVDELGDVRISTRVEDDSVVVAISDTGRGIPEEQRSRIFEPFFTTKPVGEGTGLGLSISYGIIERHEGTIAVASTVGVGTTFTVRIPVRKPEPGEQQNQEDPETNS